MDPRPTLHIEQQGNQFRITAAIGHDSLSCEISVSVEGGLTTGAMRNGASPRLAAPRLWRRHSMTRSKRSPDRRGPEGANAWSEPRHPILEPRGDLVSLAANQKASRVLRRVRRTANILDANQFPLAASG